MPHPPSFFRSWGRRDRAQTSPTQGSTYAAQVPAPPRSSNTSPVSDRPPNKRRPSDTPSDGSTRFLRLFKSNYALDTDTSSLASVGKLPQPQTGSASRSPHSLPFHHPPTDVSDERPSPLLSPASLDRPLPPVPPYVGTRRTLHRQPLIPDEPSVRPGRKMPELDNVWEGFIRDAEEEDTDEFALFLPRRSGPFRDRPYASSVSLNSRGAEHIFDPSFTRKPRPAMYRAGGSESTPYLIRTPDLTSDSDSELSGDETTQKKNVQFPLSLFPPPPPLPHTRRRAAPKPLVLLPTPSIAPLPPSPAMHSPSFSSAESTPVATPTTARKSASPSPISILKKSGSSLSARPRLDSTPPTTPGLEGGLPSEAGSTRRIPSPRLRTAQSVPHLQPLLPTASNSHRNTSSDTTSMNHRRRVASRPPVDARPHLVRAAHYGYPYL
ncbi:hypothetical protein C8R46DRAFT_1073022 [Mycena filopes]|nr:hypothetical protein C8R46DRAFT_1073022 [Mycena filopes]